MRRLSWSWLVMAAFVLLAGVLAAVGPGAAPAPTVGKPLPAPITMTAVRIWPLGLGEQLTEPARLAVDTPSWADLVVGVPMDATGRGVTLERSDSSILLTEASSAGRYSAVSGQQTATGLAEAGELRLDVRDLWVWAVVAALAGVLLAVRLEGWFAGDAPRGAHRVRLAALRESSAKSSEREQRAIEACEEWVGGDRLPARLVSDDGRSGLLVAVEADVLADFDGTPSLEVRESRWGPQGTEYAKLLMLVSEQFSFESSGPELNRRFLALRASLGPDVERELNESTLGAAVRATLTGSAPSSRAEWEDLVGQRALASTVASRALDVADVLSAIEQLPEVGDGDRTAIRAIRLKLAKMPTLGKAQVRSIAVETEELYNAIVVRPALAGDTISDIEYMLQGTLGVDTMGPGPQPFAAASSSALAASLRRINRLYLLVAGVVVLVASLSAGYLANPVYGSAADYAGTFVWAFTASGVAQLAKWYALGRAYGHAAGEQGLESILGGVG
ncbi:MAG: hypothetical protein U0838_05770 [Chloroflexota bacterium]